MAHAALLSGVALANSGLGLAHGVAAALGVTARVPHGLACAVMLPVALRVNREASRPQLAELARATLDGGASGGRFSSDAAAADAFIERIDRLAEEVGIPKRLGEVGVRGEQIPELVRGSRGNSMHGNPRQLSDEELTRLLEDLL
jgi:alcohol dehydrogenase class IV